MSVSAHTNSQGIIQVFVVLFVAGITAVFLFVVAPLSIETTNSEEVLSEMAESADLDDVLSATESAELD